MNGYLFVEGEIILDTSVPAMHNQHSTVGYNVSVK